jgi:predicted membrane-bound mannosyltransferase
LTLQGREQAKVGGGGAPERVPLSIPAAVGLGRVVDWGRGALVADDAVGLTAVAVALLVLGGVTAGVVTNSVYLNDQSEDNYLVQYAQPGDSPRAELEAIDRVARDEGRDGPDVLLFYGEEGDQWSDGDALVERDPAEWNRSHYSYQPLCSKWFNALPLPWYFASSDADVDCAREPGNVTERLDDSPPAVIVTVAGDGTTPESALAAEYSSETYEMRTYGTRMTFWVHESVQIDREAGTGTE